MFQHPAATVCKQNTEKKNEETPYIEICTEKAACKEQNRRSAFRWKDKITQSYDSQKYREKKRYKHITTLHQGSGFHLYCCIIPDKKENKMDL